MRQSCLNRKHMAFERFGGFASGTGIGMMLGSTIIGTIYTSKAFNELMEKKKKALNK